MCINIYLRHGNACLCFNVFIALPSPNCPLKRKKQQKMKNFCRPTSHQISSSFFSRSSTLEMSVKLFLCLTVHVSSPPRRLCIGRFDENRRMKLKQYIETGKKSAFGCKKSGESNRIEDFKPQLDGNG